MRRSAGPFEVFFQGDDGRTLSLGVTTAVSKAQAVNNVWWRTVNGHVSVMSCLKRQMFARPIVTRSNVPMTASAAAIEFGSWFSRLRRLKATVPKNGCPRCGHRDPHQRKGVKCPVCG